MLVDKFERQFRYLRLSITDVCNFKCGYCLPNGYQKPTSPKSEMSLSEIKHLLSAFAALGMQKIRITGGEPSIRKDLNQIIQICKSTQGIQQIAMTTNGYQLKQHARSWYEAGLEYINISIDSLNANEFKQMTGKDYLHQILEGIDQCLELGYQKIKLNAVLLKSFNHHSLNQFLNYIQDKPINIRFIELMQTGQVNAFFRQHHISGQSIQTQLLQNHWQIQDKQLNDGPAINFKHDDYQGQVGLIMPYDQSFCDSCNRLRVSQLGELQLCLFGDTKYNLRDLCQSHDQIDDLKARIKHCLGFKSKQHALHQQNTGITPHLASIGG